MVDWSKVRYFKELRSRPDINGVKPELIYELDDFREFLGYPIVVSPVDGAIVATTGHSPNSYHYKGMAIDVFPMCSPILLGKLFQYNPFGAVGFYFDTYLRSKERMMCHFDIRPLKHGKYTTVWFRKDGKYFYEGSFSKPEEFWKELFQELIIRS